MPLILMLVSALALFSSAGYLALGLFGAFDLSGQHTLIGLVVMCVGLFGMVFFSAVDDAVKEADLNQQIIDILDGK